MKKTYEKPMAYFEDMSFDTAIASLCDWIYTTTCNTQLSGTDHGECMQFGPDINTKWFTADTVVCEDGECICYHISAADYKLAYQS